MPLPCPRRAGHGFDTARAIWSRVASEWRRLMNFLPMRYLGRLLDCVLLEVAQHGRKVFVCDLLVATFQRGAGQVVQVRLAFFVLVVCDPGGELLGALEPCAGLDVRVLAIIVCEW